MDGALTIVQNGSLFGIHGFADLTYVGINSFKDDNSLNVIHGFSNLVFTIWNFPICCNYSLTSTSGFENLASIGECLVMSPPELLCHIDDLPSSHSLGDDLVIDSNERLCKVIGFLSLGSVGTRATAGHQHLQNHHVFIQVVHPSMGEMTTSTARHIDLQDMFAR